MNKDISPQTLKDKPHLKRIGMSNKGNWCKLNPNPYCQEGYCSGCEIYQKRKRQ